MTRGRVNGGRRREGKTTENYREMKEMGWREDAREGDEKREKGRPLV